MLRRVLAATLAFPSIAAPQPAEPVAALTLNQPIRRVLAGEQHHVYRLSLQAGQLARGVVDQEGVDVVVTVFRPNGNKELEVDSPNGIRGPEPFALVADATGAWRIEVRSLSADANGQYQIRMVELRAAASRDRPQVAAERLQSDAMVLVALDSLDQAVAKYHAAVGLFVASGDRSSEAQALTAIGRVFRDTRRWDSAIAYFQRALPITREIKSRNAEAIVLYSIGQSYRAHTRFDSALVYLHLALVIDRERADLRGEMSTLTQIGNIHGAMGRLDSAMTYYRVSLARAVARHDSLGQGIGLNNIGLLHHNGGRFDSALVYYRQALPIRRAIQERHGVAATLHNIGQTKRALGQLDSAVVYYQLALPIERAERRLDYEAVTLNNLAGVYVQTGKRDSAAIYFRVASNIHHQIGDREGESRSLQNIGSYFAESGQPDSALVYLRRALAIQVQAGLGIGEAATRQAIGAAFALGGQRDSALPYYRTSLAMAREIGDRATERAALHLIAKLHRTDPAPGSLVLASRYFDSAAAVLASISSNAGAETNRVTYRESQTDLFNEWSLALLAPGAGTPGHLGILAALAAAERGRAQALLELMQDSSTSVVPGRDLVSEGRELLRPALSTGAAVLSYLATGDTLLIWFARAGRETVAWQRAVGRDSLRGRIQALRRSLGATDGARGRIRLHGGAAIDASDTGPAAPPSPGSYRSTSLDLAGLLLPEGLNVLLDGIKELVIVPHGAIGLVPFAALPVDRRGTPLGSRIGIRYAPSLAVLREAERRPGGLTGSRRAALRTALVVGNPAMPARLELGDTFELSTLPEAETEGRWVASQFGVSPLTGKQASESYVRLRMPTAPLIHFATHGFAFGTEARARQSFVALAPDSIRDGFLTVGEILDEATLRFAAELVVLSACESGLGDLTEAEGTIGLQRAFLAKGARSLLVSQWNVSDRATRLLMQSFYRHWLDGISKAEALRRAQLEVRAIPGLDHPRFWAGFQLVGAS